MSSNAITEKEQRVTDQPGGGVPGGPWRPGSDIGPSRIREDEPALPRTLGMIGAALVIFGGMALAFNMYGKTVRVGTSWAILFLAFGLAGLLFHAAFDRDVQFRRMYLVFGLAILAVGVLLCVFPSPRVGALFRYGVPCIILALLFLLAFLRNETDDAFRNIAQQFLGGGGMLMAVIGLLGGSIRGEFLLPYGAVLALLGWIYLTAFVGSRGISDDLGYYAAVGMAGLGLIAVLICLARSLFPEGGANYFISYGAVLLVMGLLYSATGGILASDSPLFVLTRRELGAFFFSPMAYLVMVGFGFFSWLSYRIFLDNLVETGGRPAIEPIVQNYIIALFPVFTVVVVVPLLTMRLLSEEQRSGTLEVLLTAPVDESVVVLSKFLGALITYLVMWIPFGLFLLAIPLGGGNPFDYRPLLSFLFAMIATGGAFISMGLFFSSLTKNQIASGVLAFAGMLLLTYFYFGAYQATEGSAWNVVLTHMSYLHLWQNTLEGKITPRYMLFPLSMTILFLFMSVKVLESRKWR
jgi:ABC-type transport system involved in multi-copper enzyme maturation permease subunit